MESHKQLFASFLVLILATAHASRSPVNSPFDFTPSSLIDYLNSISGSHTISGQFIEFGPLDPIEAIYNNTGKWLGLIGGDYWWFGQGLSDGGAYYSFNDVAISYWQANGLITISTSWPNPTTGGGIDDVSYLAANDLLTPGTTTNENFMGILNATAFGIQQLQKAGVVVMYRPFHESNGNWFWWGTSFLSTQQFISAWQYVHDYFTGEMGLDNIVWIFTCAPDCSRYPGDDYVDIVGQDSYTSTPSDSGTSYNILQGLGKPICMAEFGSGNPAQGDPNFNETDLIEAFKNEMQNTVFWQQWWDGNGGNPGWGMAEVQGVSEALNDPWVLNRGDISFFTKRRI